MFDYTMMSTFLTCRRKYKFRMVDNIVPKIPAMAPEFGRCIHKALDNWYKSKDPNRASDEFKAMYHEELSLDDKRTHQMGEWIIHNYHEKYIDQPFEVLEYEHEFSIKLPNECKLIGRMDKLIKWDNVIWVMDHKTTSSLGPQFFKSHTPNLQFDGYTYAARKLGYDCKGVLVDAILVAKGLLPGPGKNGNLTPLARDFAYRTDEQLVIYEQAIQKIQQDIQLCSLNSEYDDAVYYPNYDACIYYGECPYRRICIEDKAIWPKIIAQDYETNIWDPHQKS